MHVCEAYLNVYRMHNAINYSTGWKEWKRKMEQELYIEIQI